MNVQEKAIKFLYRTFLGRILLRILIRPWVSNLAGSFLDKPVSTILIPGFIERNHIDMSQYEEQKYRSYNDFFTRKVKKECRPINQDKDLLIAPCDAKLSVYQIWEGERFQIKGTEYTLEQLFHSKSLAKRYREGTLLLFRLAVDDYHRYCYIDDGCKSGNYRIPGVFHTVNPMAGEQYPIYKENTREFSLLKSKNFGNVLTMEVGAMLVGRIVNNDEAAEVTRGQEKGRFEFGGSTIIVCLEHGAASIMPEIRRNSINGIETVVKMGQPIGHKCK